MRTVLSLAAVIAICGSVSAQWSDDFNRPDGPIGGDWTEVSGSWAIVNQQGTHTSTPAHEYLQHNSATLAYVNSVSTLDVFAPGSTSQFSAVLIGLGGADTIQVKVQDQVSATPGFSNVGIYHRNGTNWGAWAGTGTGFAALTAPFLSGRMKVFFSDPDTIVLEIDTDFDGVADQTYSKTGVTSIAPSLGTDYGIMAWGSTALFDNWGVSGGLPPAPVSYCTAGTSTNGCTATVSASGNPSVTQATPCTITINAMEGQKSGILFYGQSPLPQPWCPTGGGSSFLCVKAPVQRTLTSNSGGTLSACDGSITLDWDAFQLANPTSLGNPWSAGDKVYAQGWYRDPASCKTTSLSDALDMTYLP